MAVFILAAPLALEAQQTGKVHRIGVLEVVGVASNAPAALAAKQATQTIPIVMASSGEPEKTAKAARPHDSAGAAAASGVHHSVSWAS